MCNQLLCQTKHCVATVAFTPNLHVLRAYDTQLLDDASHRLGRSRICGLLHTNADVEMYQHVLKQKLVLSTLIIYHLCPTLFTFLPRYLQRLWSTVVPQIVSRLPDPSPPSPQHPPARSKSNTIPHSPSSPGARSKGPIPSPWCVPDATVVLELNSPN